jgi:hypothetical protein
MARTSMAIAKTEVMIVQRQSVLLRRLGGTGISSGSPRTLLNINSIK